jgi:hypothetical protein
VSARWIEAAIAGAMFSAGVACAGSEASEERRETRAAIVLGEPSPSPDDDAVVLLRHELQGGEFLCTGALVAPNLVVTARHCVAYVNDGLFQCSVRGEAIPGPDGGGILGADVPPESIEVYAHEVPGAVPVAKGRQIVSTLSLTSCVNDLAFVVLDRSLSLPVASVRLGTKTVAGEAVTVLGYGIEQAGPAELAWPARPRKKARQTIASVGPDSDDDVTTLRPRTLVTQGPSVCQGDSGGPALSDKTRAVVGIYTLHGGSDDCTSPAVVHYYTNLSPFVSLAQDAFAAAGAQPVAERRSTFGQPCTRASDCEEGVCVEGDDGAQTCSRACGPSAACPAGYDCRPPATPEGPNACTALGKGDGATCPTCDAAPTPAPPRSDGGCSTSSAGPRNASAACMALALAWATFTRRRSSQPRRRPDNRRPSRTRTV